jgi:hypothetical protein
MIAVSAFYRAKMAKYVLKSMVANPDFFKNLKSRLKPNFGLKSEVRTKKNWVFEWETQNPKKSKHQILEYVTLDCNYDYL